MCSNCLERLKGSSWVDGTCYGPSGLWWRNCAGHKLIDLWWTALSCLLIIRNAQQHHFCRRSVVATAKAVAVEGVGVPAPMLPGGAA